MSRIVARHSSGKLFLLLDACHTHLTARTALCEAVPPVDDK
jgi:hypothetical protein